MGLLPTIAGLIGVNVEALLRQLRESAVAYSVIGLFALICLTFLLVALYTWLALWVGPIWAPLIIAGAALVLALIVFLALRVQEAANKQRAELQRHEVANNAMMANAALSLLPELIASPVVRNVGLPLALYAGFLMLVSNEKRQPPR